MLFNDTHFLQLVKPVDLFLSLCVSLLLLSMGSGQSKEKLHCNRYLDNKGPPSLEVQGLSQTYTPILSVC